MKEEQNCSIAVGRRENTTGVRSITDCVRLNEEQKVLRFNLKHAFDDETCSFRQSVVRVTGSPFPRAAPIGWQISYPIAYH
jgi:hypothetical protein